jgi:ABC-type transporter Mla maintaining outer membrane lipid asymmetry permease subunit MlaE
MRKLLLQSSVIYRIYAILIDLIVVSILLDILGFASALIITLILNAVKMTSYYLYHNIFIKIIHRRIRDGA